MDGSIAQPSICLVMWPLFITEVSDDLSDVVLACLA